VKLPHRHWLRGLPHLAILLATFSCIRLDADDWPTITDGIRQRYPEVRQITTAELATWQARPDTVQPLLLDVRSETEFAVSHLAGAHRAEDVQSALEAIANMVPGTPIVVYCSVGYRSSRLADVLQQRGITQIANLEGSLFAWANEGRAFVDRRGQPGRLVHPYNDTWAQLLRPELVWTLHDPSDSATTQ